LAAPIYGIGAAPALKARDVNAPDVRSRLWLTVAAWLLVAGTAGSFFLANGFANSAAKASAARNDSASNDIAGTLKLALQHESDLVLAAQAHIEFAPNGTEAGFLSWARNIGAMSRYPQLEGIGLVQIVLAAQVPAFAARQAVGSDAGWRTNSTFSIVPPGARDSYCFAALGLFRSASVSLPRGYDYCTGPAGQVLQPTGTVSKPSLAPLSFQHVQILSLSVPTYRGGSAPKTAAARQASFIGWVGMLLVPGVDLTTSLENHPDTAVALRFGGVKSKIIYRSGMTYAGGDSDSINLHNGWTVVTSNPPVGGGIFSNATALALLIAGLLLTILVSAMILVLGTGRTRALALVQERTDELRYQTLHDPLTGLPNRSLILDRTEQMMARARRSHTSAAALFIDLDDFKDINDTLGHRAGDQLLTAVGERLLTALREGDTVGRLGGDEFILLVEGTAQSESAQTVANRVLELLESPFTIPESDLPLSVAASIGVAEGDRLSPDDLLRDADIALYQAKALGKHCAVVFTPPMKVTVQLHRDLALDLRDAMAKNEFFLLYQPVMNLRTNSCSGVEALLRWQHPTRGVLEPGEFIPELEMSGLIVPVGAWVLEEACRHGAAWLREGHHVAVSVNVSSKQLMLDRFIDDVKLALVVSGFDPKLLILELTETVLLQHDERAITNLTLLKTLGVRIAIDDFGTGYSSLAYLKRLPVDILKIDRSFVSKIVESADSLALVKVFVQISQALKLQTIAEGIETVPELEALRAMDVKYGQGYLFSKPLVLSEVKGFFDNSEHGTSPLVREGSAPIILPPLVTNV
jgi:diguanylate cyclase (GGDEF)-like protein